MLSASSDKRHVLCEIEVGEHLGLQAAIFQHRQNEDTGMVVIFQNGGFRRGRDPGSSRLDVWQIPQPL